MTQLTTINRQGFAPATITEAMEFSKMLSESAMVPRAYQGKPQDIMVCVQWGYEIGLAPMQALQNIAVINGKPSVYGDAAMALVQASPVCEDIEEYFEGEGTPNPIAVCVAKRKGRKPVVAKFSVEDAKRAGLWGKQGPWTAYPKRMMQMRARGFALRDAFPDVLKGLITAEEAQDYPDEAKPKQPRDITPRNPLDMVAPPVAIPQQTSDPVVIEQAFAQDAEAEELATKQDG
jgi:RecT family